MLKIILCVLICFLVACFFYGCGDTSPNTSGSTDVSAEKSKGDPATEEGKIYGGKFKVTNAAVKKGKYGEVITGTVENLTDDKFSYVQVEINLLDDEGAVVDSTMANINNIEPKQKWKFEAPILNEKATKYEIKDVTGM